MKYLIVLLLIALLGVEISNVGTVAFAYSLLVIGETCIYIFGKHDRKNYFNIFFVLFNASFLYSLICRQYMFYHDYEWLLSFDTINYFLPTTQKLIEEGSYNYIQTLKIIFEDWNMLIENQYAYWAYTTLFGILSVSLNADFYLSLQLSTIFLFAFCGIFIYKILKVVLLQKKDSYKYTLIICLFSVVFAFSSQILRDIHVLLTYLIGIFLTLQYRFNLKYLVLLLLLIVITVNLRVESGIFMLSFIPLALLSDKKRKDANYLLTLAISLIISFGILIGYHNSFLKIYNDQYEGYTGVVYLGEGMIAMLQQIPILGDFLSIMYNAVQPWPFWVRLSPSSMSKYGGEAYNIMNFTYITSSFVNYSTIVTIIYWIFNRRVHIHLSRPYKYQLLLGLFFLYLQSAVMSQRRIMAYYCLYYMLAIVVFKSISRQKRGTLVFFISISFVIFHILGMALTK